MISLSWALGRRAWQRRYMGPRKAWILSLLKATHPGTSGAPVQGSRIIWISNWVVRQEARSSATRQAQKFGAKMPWPAQLFNFGANGAPTNRDE